MYKKIIGIIAIATTVCIVKETVKSAVTERVNGHVRVIDGDTLEVSGQHVRLYGIDAFEKKQTCFVGGVSWPCGETATKAMIGVINNRDVSCEGTQHDRYNRLIGKCSVGNIDLSAFMVSQGWALAYREYSMDYVTEEQTARENSRGAWRGQFVEPWVWRKQKHPTQKGDSF